MLNGKGPLKVTIGEKSQDLPLAGVSEPREGVGTLLGRLDASPRRALLLLLGFGTEISEV